MSEYVIVKIPRSRLNLDWMSVLVTPPPTEELERLRALLNTPETEDFDRAVPLEAAHQVERWGAAKDEGKNPEDWFWLVGYLAGKALSAMKAGDMVKAKHHTISTAAALRNWHAHIRQGWTLMRPGIEEPAARVPEAQETKHAGD